MLHRIKKLARSALRAAGLRVVRTRNTRSEYGPVLPLAGYSPWNVDPGFRDAFEAVRDHTLVDAFRCWELWTVAQHAARLGGAALEVGVWRGGSGALIARQFATAGSPSPVYLADTFSGVVKAGPNDTVYRGGEHSDTSEDVVRSLLASMGLRNGVILKGIFPEDTAGRIPDSERFALCHIDVDVFESARDVLAWVWPRLQPGGVVVFDDYGFEQCPGVRVLVEQQRSLPGRLILHNLNGHALIVKIEGV